MPVQKNVPVNAPDMPVAPSRLAGVALVVVLVLLVIGAYFFFSKKQPSVSTTGTQIANQEEIQSLVQKVGKHLPVNEQEIPLVAIVTDVSAAKQQSPAFYQKAQNGDRLLVWQDKAVLYSPTLDEVESVLVFQTIQPPTPQALAAEKATIEVRNGTGVTGIANALSDRLKAQGFTVTKVSNAKAKDPYPVTLISNMGTRVLPASAQVLAGYGSAVASSTMSGEGPVTADFLIILGKNDIEKYQK